MNIDEIDYAVELRNYRQQALELKDAARSGSLDITLRYKGDQIDSSVVIGSDVLRKAIIEASDEFIAEKEKELTDLGVGLSPEVPGESS